MFLPRECHQKANPSPKEDQEEISIAHTYLLGFEPTVGTKQHYHPLCSAGSESMDTVHKSVMATHSKMELLSVGFYSCGMETDMDAVDQLML